MIIFEGKKGGEGWETVQLEKLGKLFQIYKDGAVLMFYLFESKNVFPSGILIIRYLLFIIVTVNLECI